jgi:predicted nucleic acid-binding protein
MKSDEVFVDTNILVYAHDLDAGAKRDRAGDLVLGFWSGPVYPFISVQVLQELYVNLVKKKVQPAEARQVVMDYSLWRVVDNTVAVLSDAMDMQRRFKLSLWDALIVSAAKHAGAKFIASEDLQDGQSFDGVRVKNPL